MHRAIFLHAALGLALLIGIDRFWPVWLMHGIVAVAALVVVVLGYLAWVATGRR